jgi:hypothetical protein
MDVTFAWLDGELVVFVYRARGVTSGASSIWLQRTRDLTSSRYGDASLPVAVRLTNPSVDLNF